MKTYYKATAPSGLDFYSGTIDYAGALETGKRVRITTPARKTYACCTHDVLHASDTPTETLIGGFWPCRLFEVTGRPVANEGHKYGFRSLSVVREVDAWRALGPQGRAVAAVVDRARLLTGDEVARLHAARGAARDAAWDAARDAARGAAWDAARGAARGAAWGAAWDAARDAARGAAWDAARGAAWDAAGALVVRDLITPAHYATLTGPWASVIGPAHPDDTAVTP